MASAAPSPKKPRSRADGQITGLAGELFVTAELLKRGLQTSFTLGNAKAIDIFAHNPETLKTFTVQVKALRRKNYFLLDPSDVSKEHIYVFVLLNAPSESVDYFVVPGKELAEHPPGKFGKYFGDCTMPGIHPQVLKEQGYHNHWDVFLR